ncbi:hypothetical protein AB0M20_11525 [Actinoplanes sp. NPDC051633]|uniref:hypothetical protein n=1 Tax=Actinoplanes sp. NPDC051633 TaxID=3155670 RepID=UPI00343E212B
MAVITKAHALNVIRRAYGEQHAEAMAEHLPDRIDLDDPADTKVLFERSHPGPPVQRPRRGTVREKGRNRHDRALPRTRGSGLH